MPCVIHINHIPAKCLVASFCEISVLGDSQYLTGQGSEQWDVNLKLALLLEGWIRSPPQIPSNLTCCKICNGLMGSFGLAWARFFVWVVGVFLRGKASLIKSKAGEAEVS